MSANLRTNGLLTGVFMVAVIAGGCSTASDPKVPAVQDCGIVAISSPPKYACAGKVYTAYQLAKIRLEQAKQYQSGK